LNGANRLKYNSSFRDRQAASAKAKAAMLEKFRVAPADNPERTPREEARLKIVEARKARTAEREAARIQREKALVEQEAREAEGCDLRRNRRVLASENGKAQARGDWDALILFIGDNLDQLRRAVAALKLAEIIPSSAR
jgi:hypothetical protein